MQGLFSRSVQQQGLLQQQGQQQGLLQRIRSLSTRSAFAAIDHSAAYEEAMQGRHGKQLQLTEIDAIGKDDPLFDPFREFEIGASSSIEEDYDEEDDALADDANDEEVIEEAEFREINADDDVEDVEDDDEDELDSEDNEDDNDDEDEDDDDELPFFRNDGSVPFKKSQLAKFQAGAPAGGLFCILELAGTQHKATIDDVIVSNLLKPVGNYAVGSVHTFREGVLLVGSTHKTLVGMPQVRGAEVDVMVEEITQDAKVVVFKKRRKKHSQRKNGFRRDVTMLRILDIRMPEGYNEHECVARVEPKEDN